MNVKLIPNIDQTQIELITTEMVEIPGSTQSSIHRNWTVGDIFLLSYSIEVPLPNSVKVLFLHYILNVTDVFGGRGLELIVPVQYQALTEKKLYRDAFRIPMQREHLKFEDFQQIFRTIDAPQDSYFSEGPTMVSYDTSFISPETTPIWYLLNHADTDERTMNLTADCFRPTLRFQIPRKGGVIQLTIFYNKHVQDNIDHGREFNDGMIEIKLRFF